MSAGKSRLEKREFVAAIGRFRDVKREQPGYPGIDALIEEARSKQQEALAEAIDGGNRNEQADKLKDARIWFRTALEIDPGSAEAREKERRFGTSRSRKPRSSGSGPPRQEVQEGNWRRTRFGRYSISCCQTTTFTRELRRSWRR